MSIETKTEQGNSNDFLYITRPFSYRSLLKFLASNTITFNQTIDRERFTDKLTQDDYDMFEGMELASSHWGIDKDNPNFRSGFVIGYILQSIESKRPPRQPLPKASPFINRDYFKQLAEYGPYDLSIFLAEQTVLLNNRDPVFLKSVYAYRKLLLSEIDDETYQTMQLGSLVLYDLLRYQKRMLTTPRYFQRNILK